MKTIVFTSLFLLAVDANAKAAESVAPLAVIHCVSEANSASLIRVYDKMATKAEFDETKGAVVELVYDAAKTTAKHLYTQAKTKEELEIPSITEELKSAGFDGRLNKSKLRCELLQGDLP